MAAGIGYFLNQNPCATMVAVQHFGVIFDALHAKVSTGDPYIPCG
jgi:hypothetical protein